MEKYTQSLELKKNGKTIFFDIGLFQDQIRAHVGYETNENVK